VYVSIKRKDPPIFYNQVKFLFHCFLEFFLTSFSSLLSSWKKDSMASSDGNNTSTKRSNSRKRSIEIKKAKPSNKHYDPFSKRKLGLFNKVTELSILCNVKTTLIITSLNEKLYACGYPNHDTVIKHFFDKENPVNNTEKGKKDEDRIETSRLQHETIQERLKEEKKNLQAVKETNKSSSCLPSWWDHSIDDMALESLEQFKTSLKKLKLNLVASLQGKEIHMNSSSSSTSNII